jgi:hypothetical protein
MLCPCLRFRPKELSRLFDALERSPSTSCLGPSIKKHIQDWHQCELLGTGIACKLSISVSIDVRGLAIFNFDYLLVTAKTSDEREPTRRIMLCPHLDAHFEIKSEKCHPDEYMHCSRCRIHPRVKETMLENCAEYRIQFTREFRDSTNVGDILWVDSMPYR